MARGSTTSTIISFAKGLEETSSEFYNELAQNYAEQRETFLSFVKECKLNNLLIARTYQETVSDALETGFSFEDLNLNEFEIDGKIAKNESLVSALKKATEIEEKTSQFYELVARKSRTLLATISTDFSRIAEKRHKRKLKLEALLEKIE